MFNNFPPGNDSDDENDENNENDETHFPVMFQNLYHVTRSGHNPYSFIIRLSTAPRSGLHSRDISGCPGCSWTGFGPNPQPPHIETCPRSNPTWCEACHQGLNEEPLVHESWCRN